MKTKLYFLFFLSSYLLISCSQSDSLDFDEQPQTSLRANVQMTKFTYDHGVEGAGSNNIPPYDGKMKWWTEVWLDSVQGKVFNVSGGVLTTSKDGVTSQALLDYFWNAKKESGGKHTIYTSYTNPFTKKHEELEYELDPTTGVLKPKKKLTEMGIND